MGLRTEAHKGAALGTLIWLAFVFASGRIIELLSLRGLIATIMVYGFWFGVTYLYGRWHMSGRRSSQEEE